MRRAVLILALAALPMQTIAQDDAAVSDRDYLTALLEDNLSGAGRQVVITGFEGALSSQAKIAEMTIADDQGVWITLKDVILDWTRSDLLLGRVTVNTLSAGEIDLARLPQSESEVVAEASPFALPELPVSISIGAISAQSLRLGAPVLGQEVTASITAALKLAGGEGSGNLQIKRLDEDAPSGLADVAISFANASRELMLDINISEGAGGILAQNLGIEGAPALEFSAKGAGPLSDFAAQITLNSDGVQRFGGTVKTASQSAGDVTADSTFEVDLSGDISPLMTPAYRAFFGSGISVKAQGTSLAAGGFAMDRLRISAQALDISGSLVVDAAGVPSSFDLNAKVQDPSGAPIVLPLGLDMPATILGADLKASFDVAKGETWVMAANLGGWQQDDLRVLQTQIIADGTLRAGPSGAEWDGDISFSAEGVQPARASLSRALGSVIWGGGKVAWRDGALALSELSLNGEDYQIGLAGRFGGLAQGVTFDGAITANAQDMSRFSDILGHPIAGAAGLTYQGKAVLLTQAFEGKARLNTTDLRIGIPALDATLQGAARVEMQAARGPKGIDLSMFFLRARGANLDLAGKIAAGGLSLSGDFVLLDLPVAERGFGGQVAGKIDLSGTLMDALARISARSSGLSLPQPMFQELADKDAEFTAEVALKNLLPQLQRADLTSAALSAQIAPSSDNGRYDLRFALADLGMILPEFPGPMTATGTAAILGDGADLDISITGPAGLDAKISGFASSGQSNDLRANGRADAGLINGFIAPRSMSGQAVLDLALRGAPSLAGLSGRITLTDGRFADPSLPFSLQSMAASLDIAAARADVKASARSTSGGRLDVSGQLSATAPFAADLAITMRELVLRDPDLYETSVSGKLALTGPLTGGAQIAGTINLGRTEVQLKPPATSFATLPELRHRNDTLAVQQTRQRAGFDQRDVASSSAAPFGLNVTVRALNRLFVRGRGLDAELGGELRLRGTTTDVRPDGAFDLVQGRFDILTKRLDLEAVRLEMQGQLIPYLSVRATNLRNDVTTTAIIEGPATDPELTFTSSPEMPQEDILAMLLFDQNLQGLTTLQVVQLTGAIATLSGRGDGIIGRIRRTLKLDNLDLQTDQTGKTALKLGKYVSDNVYSELSGDSEGQQSLDFTYTLNSKIKLRAGAETTGNTSLGIEFETNY